MQNLSSNKKASTLLKCEGAVTGLEFQKSLVLILSEDH